MKNQHITSYLSILSSLGVLLFAVPALAAETTPDTSSTTTPQVITFPIATLGNCASAAACKDYCDIEEHHATCEAFAEAKGLKRDAEGNVIKNRLLAAAKEQFGCTTREECKAYCKEITHQASCQNLAKQFGIMKKHEGEGDAKKNEIAQKAKELLGCDSRESCKAFCEDAANHEKCQNFAKEVGLRHEERSNEDDDMKKDDDKDEVEGVENENEDGEHRGDNKGKNMEENENEHGQLRPGMIDPKTGLPFISNSGPGKNMLQGERREERKKNSGKGSVSSKSESDHEDDKDGDKDEDSNDGGDNHDGGGDDNDSDD